METFGLIVVIIGAGTLSAWIMHAVDWLEH